MTKEVYIGNTRELEEYLSDMTDTEKDALILYIHQKMDNKRNVEISIQSDDNQLVIRDFLK